MLPYLQLPTLTPIQRSEVRAGRIDLDRLRECAASAAGTEPPPLIQLRRVTAGSIVRVVLPALALLALISILAGLDLAELADQLREAAWWILLVAFLLAQTPRLTQAISTLGAAPLPLPLGPVYALQLATSYINMAVPSAAGRVGMGIRFFQRHGVPPNSAIAAGAIDTGTSFVVEAALVVGLVLFAPSSLDLNLDAATESAWSLLVVVIVIAAAAIVLVAVVAPWRRFTVRWVSRIYAELGTAVRGLSSPRRIAMLVGGNLATEFLFAIALATFAQAFGYPIGLGEALLINTSAAFLAAVIPIPGGIGVAEAVLAFGLVHTGVPEEVALTIALSYRLSTSYLPPIWGFVAFRWLERNDHL